MAFQKASRSKQKLRLAICGPSGSGKTYTSLLIAEGLCPGGKVAFIDTEHGSGALYSHLFEYYHESLLPPFSPDRFSALIHEAEEGGFDCLIIDSLSHAWAGQGGILDIHMATTEARRDKNSFSAWGSVTPKHTRLLETIVGSKLHIITTMRTKTKYEIVDDGRGKTKPVKLGMEPIQRDGVDYEFTMVLDMALDSHMATVSKTRIDDFDGKVFVPTRDTGAKLKEWLDVGDEPVARVSDIIYKVNMAEDLSELSATYRICSSDIAKLSNADKDALRKVYSVKKSSLTSVTQKVFGDEEI